MYIKVILSIWFLIILGFMYMLFDSLTLMLISKWYDTSYIVSFRWAILIISWLCAFYIVNNINDWAKETAEALSKLTK